MKSNVSFAIILSIGHILKPNICSDMAFPEKTLADFFDIFFPFFQRFIIGHLISNWLDHVASQEPGASRHLVSISLPKINGLNTEKRKFRRS